MSVCWMVLVTSGESSSQLALLSGILSRFPAQKVIINLRGRELEHMTNSEVGLSESFIRYSLWP